MRVLILPIEDHRIQVIPRVIHDPRGDRERKRFELVLRKLVRDRTVDLIGEETYPEKNTIAKKVANRLGLRWEAIEMSLKARDELGITEDQNNRPHGNETRVSSDGIREEFMVWKSLHKAGGAQSILIICGRMHKDAVAQKFREAGHKVDLDGLCNYV